MQPARAYGKKKILTYTYCDAECGVAVKMNLGNTCSNLSHYHQLFSFRSINLLKQFPQLLLNLRRIEKQHYTD